MSQASGDWFTHTVHLGSHTLVLLSIRRKYLELGDLPHRLLLDIIRMARLSSAFESRPESGSILDLLEAQCSNARRHLANTAIGLQGLAQRGSIFGPHPNYGPDIEPLPVIDYHLLSILINLSRPSLDPRDLKRFDYLADARKNYYRAHQEFEYCYRGLQDVAANGIILDEEKQRLEASGVSQKELENNQSARMKNYGDKEKALGQLEQRRRNREKITAWFSNMKVDFLVGDMPRLVFVGRHVYQRVHLPGNPKYSHFGPLTVCMS